MLQNEAQWCYLKATKLVSDVLSTASLYLLIRNPHFGQRHRVVLINR